MAFIKYKNGKGQVMDSVRATKIWLSMHGYLPVDQKQKKYINTIDKVYLNPDNAPKVYLRKIHQSNEQLTFISNK